MISSCRAVIGLDKNSLLHRVVAADLVDYCLGYSELHCNPLSLWRFKTQPSDGNAPKTTVALAYSVNTTSIDGLQAGISQAKIITKQWRDRLHTLERERLAKGQSRTLSNCSIRPSKVLEALDDFKFVRTRAPHMRHDLTPQTMQELIGASNNWTDPSLIATIARDVDVHTVVCILECSLRVILPDEWHEEVTFAVNGLHECADNMFRQVSLHHRARPNVATIQSLAQAPHAHKALAPLVSTSSVFCHPTALAEEALQHQQQQKQQPQASAGEGEPGTSAGVSLTAAELAAKQREMILSYQQQQKGMGGFGADVIPHDKGGAAHSLPRAASSSSSSTSSSTSSALPFTPISVTTSTRIPAPLRAFDVTSSTRGPQPNQKGESDIEKLASTISAILPPVSVSPRKNVPMTSPRGEVASGVGTAATAAAGGVGGGGGVLNEPRSPYQYHAEHKVGDYDHFHEDQYKLFTQPPADTGDTLGGEQYHFSTFTPHSTPLHTSNISVPPITMASELGGGPSEQLQQTQMNEAPSSTLATSRPGHHHQQQQLPSASDLNISIFGEPTAGPPSTVSTGTTPSQSLLSSGGGAKSGSQSDVTGAGGNMAGVRTQRSVSAPSSSVTPISSPPFVTSSQDIKFDAPKEIEPKLSSSSSAPSTSLTASLSDLCATSKTSLPPPMTTDTTWTKIDTGGEGSQVKVEYKTPLTVEQAKQQQQQQQTGKKDTSSSSPSTWSQRE